MWLCFEGRNPCTHLDALSPDPPAELEVAGHDGHALGVNSTQIGVLEEMHEVGFGRLLQSKYGGALETKVTLEVLGDLAHEALERELANEELGRLLIATDLTKRNRSRSVPVGLLDAARCWG